MRSSISDIFWRFGFGHNMRRLRFWTFGAKDEKAVVVWRKLFIGTFYVAFLGAVIFYARLDFQHLGPVHYQWIINSSDVPGQESFLSGEQCNRVIWDFCCALLYSINKDLPIISEVSRGKWPEILESKAERKAGSLFVWPFAWIRNSARVDSDIYRHHTADSDVWSIGALCDPYHVLISKINFDRVSSVNSKQKYPAEFNKWFPSIPPVLFLLASDLAMGVGWWKLRTGRCWRDFWFGITGLLVGYPASVWGWVVFGDGIF